MKRMAIISAGFVPVPAVDGGAGEVLTTYIIEGNEKAGDYFMDIYTIESPKLNSINYKNAEIIQIHISFINGLLCKVRNMFLKIFKMKYRFIPYNRKLLKEFRDNYDVILVENNMQVYEDIYNHSRHGTDNMFYHMHNDIDGTTKPEYLCKKIAETAKGIFTVSNYIKEHFYEVAPNDKMDVLYNCIDLEKFDVNKDFPTKSLKEKYGISENDFVFMYTGRICPEKGILELVRAFKEIVNKYENVKLLIVGSRWYNLIARDEYYKRLISESESCKGKIIFTGYIYPKEMPAIYTLADALVIPTLCEEAFGMVVLEGMAMKIPIIATNSGGIPEIIDSDTAIIIDKNKDVVSGLADSMRELLLDKDKRNEISNRAYSKLREEKNYDKNSYFQHFSNMISKYNN